MPAERTVMRQVREVLRLKFVGGVPIRAIARRIGIAASTVRATINRLQAAGLSWPLPADMTDAVLEAMLYADAGGKQGYRRQIEPDWSNIHRELKRKHVTLSLLWHEYIERNPQGYRYSRFCELYRSWEGRLSLTMRQTHVGGDKLFVDYAGDTVPVVIDRLTGETREAQIFVAVMGASNFTYVEATWTQGLADWIGAHTRAFAAIGGVPCLVVPDNAKVAIIKACLYEPQVNRTYAEMAAHYGTAVLPTRPRRPRDKAKVETAVLIIERWILARLRQLAQTRPSWSVGETCTAAIPCMTRTDPCIEDCALTLLAEQSLCSIVQAVDQAVGAPRSDDGGKFIPARREITDCSVEIDVDYPLAADQIIYAHSPPVTLHQLCFDDFAAAARFRNRLRVDSETFAGIIFYLARVISNDEPRERLADRRLLLRRECSPGRPHSQPRHCRQVEYRLEHRRKAPIALAHGQPCSLLDCGHKLLIIALDLGDGGAWGLCLQWGEAGQRR